MARPKKVQREKHGKRAVIYIRVSTEEQAQGGHYGPDAQWSSCADYIQKKKYTAVTTQSDLGISGAKGIDDRPGLASSMMLCESGMADVIVCYAQDRLARKSGVFEDIRERAIRGGYRLETAREGQDLTADENELSADAMSFVASIERKMIARRLYSGRKERSKVDGRGSSIVPYGYKVKLVVEGDEVQKYIEIDSEAAKVVRLILKHRKTKTYQQVADYLNKKGYTTPRSNNQWTVGHVQGIERNKELYTTGIRRWDGIEAAERWPVLMEKKK